VLAARRERSWRGSSVLIICTLFLLMILGLLFG